MAKKYLRCSFRRFILLLCLCVSGMANAEDGILKKAKRLRKVGGKKL